MLVLALTGAVALDGCGGGAEEPGSRPASAGTSSPSSPATGAAASTVGDAAGPRHRPHASRAAPLSAAGSRAQADAICARRNRELRGARPTGAGLAGTAEAASRRAAIEWRALAELSALSPPAGAAARWKSMIDQTEIARSEVAGLADAARKGDREGVTKKINPSAKTQFRLLAAAGDAGVRHCTVVG